MIAKVDPYDLEFSTAEGYLRNLQALFQIAAWGFSDSDILELFERDPEVVAKASVRGELQRRLNRDVTRTVMLVLCHRALMTRGRDLEEFSLRRLATAIDAPRRRAIEDSLRKWILPTLSRAGMIDGYDERAEPSNDPHEVRVSAKGLRIHLAYLKRFDRELRPVEAELESKRKPSLEREP